MLMRLLYRSEATSVGAALRADLDAIAAQSQRNNATADISGALVHFRGEFAQSLEGRPKEVAACFDRVLHDPRHRKLQLIESRSVDQRKFLSFSMAFEDLDQNQDLYLLNGMIEPQNLFAMSSFDLYRLLAAITRSGDHAAPVRQALARLQSARRP